MAFEAIHVFAKRRSDAAVKNESAGTLRRPTTRLFRKYVLLFVSVVLTALAASGGSQIWFAYREQTEALARIQNEQALAAAGKIGQFVKEIEGQLGWTVQLPWSTGGLEQRRFDALRLLRQVPAITELSQIDPTGREQLRVSRLAMDTLGSNLDFSSEPKFTQAAANKVFYGPVYFRRESEPYMTLAIAGSRRDAGVSAAEVNLKFIWDVITQIRVGEKGYAYVVDQNGRLIAHPDISLVLRNTRVPGYPLNPNVKPPLIGQDLQGREVITATAVIPALRWNVVVDLPTEEARAPLYAFLARTAALMATGFVLALVTGVFLARRMVVPIRELQRGAAEIGAGDFKNKINVHTGDELEALADQFNEMAQQLQESHRDLETKIEERTLQLAQSVRELTALGEVGIAVNSTLELDTVLTTIVTKAVELCETDTGGIYVFNEADGEFHLRATCGASDTFVSKLDRLHIRMGDTLVGEAAEQGRPVQISDVSKLPAGPIRELLEADSYRSVLAVPLLRANSVIGALVIRRREAGEFPQSTIQLLQTFAGQSVLAVHNARLFTELHEKSRQLELASQHKSQFLANMSHELRTPLNAIIGYTELIADETYGAVPERALNALERVQVNGKHLLGLINDVLDLSKIEAGQLELALAEYEPRTIVRSVASSMASMAKSKGIELLTEIQEPLPVGIGDERRLTQVLINLVGNAIKFTETGHVEIKVGVSAGFFEYSVQDTGPGISPENQTRIFGEFQQVDDSSTRTKGGTGLGLSITKSITEMHGGHISVRSEPGKGSNFVVCVPVRVEKKNKEAA